MSRLIVGVLLALTLTLFIALNRIEQAPVLAMVGTTRPTLMLTPVPSSTLSLPSLYVVSPNLNIRAGPGTNFPIIAALKTGETAFIIGRNVDFTWWVVEKDQARGWVINSPAFIRLIGDTSNVPLVQPPPTPVPTLPEPTLGPSPVAADGQAADLVFGNIILTPRAPTVYETFYVSVDIYNQGTADAGYSVLVGICQRGDQISAVAVPPIKQGQYVTVFMPVTLNVPGIHQAATLILDRNNDVHESRNGELNNTRVIYYAVYPPSIII